ncbi:UDP-glycosyltransferase 79B9 [Linum perenne]
MPPGFPSSLRLSLRPGDLASTRGLFDFFGELGAPGIRARRGVAGSEALVIWSCREIDSQFNSYLETLFQKPLFLTGPLLRRNLHLRQDGRKWDDWMNKFPPKSVIYCAFGSELTPDKDQFQELLLGFELCNRPFIVATTKPPRGCSTIEESFPEDFLARVEGRGKVHCGWVPQVRILGHESSTTTMFMVEELKVAVEVERAEEGGWVGKEELSRAIGMAMDEESELGRLLKKNHDMYRSMIMGEGVQDSYTDDFICKLHALMDG